MAKANINIGERAGARIEIFTYKIADVVRYRVKEVSGGGVLVEMCSRPGAKNLYFSSIGSSAKRCEIGSSGGSVKRCSIKLEIYCVKMEENQKEAIKRS